MGWRNFSREFVHSSAFHPIPLDCFGWLNLKSSDCLTADHSRLIMEKTAVSRKMPSANRV